MRMWGYDWTPSNSEGILSNKSLPARHLNVQGGQRHNTQRDQLESESGSTPSSMPALLICLKTSEPMVFPSLRWEDG